MTDPKVLIEGVLFRAKYLGSTQLVCEGQPTKATRMMQAEEAVSRIKVIIKSLTTFIVFASLKNVVPFKSMPRKGNYDFKEKYPYIHVDTLESMRFTDLLIKNSWFFAVHLRFRIHLRQIMT